MAKAIYRSSGHKSCNGCDTTKPFSEFSKHIRKKDGLQTRCKLCDTALAGEWQRKNPTAAALNNRRTKLRNRFGIVPEDYDRMLLAQEVKCAICFSEKPGGSGSNFPVDHDHDTGTVRGLLCQQCNTGIGSLKDSPTVLASALRYLHRHGKALSTDEVAELVNLHQSPHQET